MSTMEKFYPKIGVDKGGKKFSFHYWDKHFTMRFSGKPMIMLEKFFILFWGTKEDFMKLWDMASSKEAIPETYKEDLWILHLAMSRVEEINEVFELCDDDQKSPFVIYVNDYNTYKQ